MNGSIYKITNDVNDKIYVGKTLLNIQKRFFQHKAESLRNKNEKRPLYRAMNKYGYEHFHIELIEECPVEILSDKEIYWINFYDSYKTVQNQEEIPTYNLLFFDKNKPLCRQYSYRMPVVR